MEPYNGIFNTIYKLCNDNKNIENTQKDTHINSPHKCCKYCGISMFLNHIYDQYICERCGNCYKAYQEYNEFRPYFEAFKPSHRHKYLRLKRMLKRMKIESELHETIKNIFKSIIYFFVEIGVQKRHNIIRYDYLILRILEFMKIKCTSQYQLNLTKRTLKKYNQIWIEFCEYYSKCDKTIDKNHTG